jgi:adenosylhomocysteine nucleosidase
LPGKRGHVKILNIANEPVLFVMAIDAEYGDELKKRFEPLFTGVGPVEAGITLATTLERLAGADRLPRLIVSLGSAGSSRLEQTEVYSARTVSYRDMDASPLGFDRGVTPFLDLPAELELPHAIPGIAAVRLSTGANIVSGAAYDDIDADMVDMETYAVLRAAMRQRTPVVALRGISDGAAELHHIDDWMEYLHIVDEKLAKAVDMMAAAIETGEIALRPF